MRDLSELGACVRTDAPLESGRVVTMNVQNGYSFLFRAEARIVWRSTTSGEPGKVECDVGVLFDQLSPFARKLIRRLSGWRPAGWVLDADPDWQVFFDAEATTPADAAAAHAVPPSRLGEEFSGNLGYFDNTFVLQMLEGSSATGVLHIDGPYPGQIRLSRGRICGATSPGLTEGEALYRLVLARRGRFRFVRGPVIRNGHAPRTTAEVVLELQLRRDRES